MKYTLMPDYRKIITCAWRLIATIIGMSGLRLDRPIRQIAVSVTGIAVSIAVAEVYINSPAGAWTYVAAVWCVYYLAHSALFAVGLNHWLNRRLGLFRAYSVYETLLGIVFFNQGWCQVKLLAICEGSLIINSPELVVTAVGSIVFLLGFVTKVWSTTLVGLDVYYYRDLFLDRPGDAGLVSRGPYSAFENPMYGVGNLTAYAGALGAHCIEGFAVAAVFQASIYAFNFMIEQPFVRRVYAEETVPVVEDD